MSKYDTDLFGLDEFGNPQGLAEHWGAAIGAFSQSASAVAMRKFGKAGKWTKYSELLGAVVGVAAGGVMYGMGHKSAGITSALTAAITGGVRQVAQLTKLDPGLGIATYDTVPTLGYAAINRQALVPGSQGLSGPPQLEGASFKGTAALGAQQAQLVGAQVSGLSSHFGSTIFG